MLIRFLLWQLCICLLITLFVISTFNRNALDYYYLDDPVLHVLNYQKYLENNNISAPLVGLALISNNTSKTLQYSKRDFFQISNYSTENKSDSIPVLHIDDSILETPTEKSILTYVIIAITVTDSTPAGRINAFRQQFRSFNVSNYKTKFYYFFLVGEPRDSIITIEGPDVIRTGKPENMNEGKTLDLLRQSVSLVHALNFTASSSRIFIFKMDTDVSVNLSRLDHQISMIKEDSYIGYVRDHISCGSGSHCPPVGCGSFQDYCWIYMSGGLYGLSLDMAESIVNCPYAQNNYIGFEDLMVGLWLKNCVPSHHFQVDAFQTPNFYCHSKQLSDYDIMHSLYHDCLKLF